MGRSRKLAIVVWALAFALSIFLLFILPKHLSNSIYLTLLFDAIAFVSTLALWFALFKSNNIAKELFHVSPAITVSVVYLVIQFIICIVEGLLADSISFRMSLILNVVVMVVMWILILSTLMIRNHVQRVDSRQKDHHVEL